MNQYDSIELYCRRLGHHITFQYCRCCDEGTPCFKIMDCAFELLPIQRFLRQHYPESVVKTTGTPTKQKITSLLELIEKAKQRQPTSDD